MDQDPKEAVPEEKEKSGATKSGSQTQHHNYRILQDAIGDNIPASPKFKQPMVFDLLLAVGLLVAVGGFTSGLIRIYVTHVAKDNINQHNYKAAINILKRNPVPDFFSGFGSDPNELLNQALYLDAIEKLEEDPNNQTAVNQLNKINAGSRFFSHAQQIINEKTVPSNVQLKQSVTKEGEAVEPKEEEKLKEMLDEPED
ncbi:MAG: hypothetical protein SFY67_08810 [Candidatus Melainabacteria bacterium]|nr:hypothetical protein [Candidatus Melainabacteria bacterium]